MTAKELKKYIDKNVYHFNRRYHEKTPYILKGVRSDRKQGIVYAVLQDRNVKNSYIRVRIEDIGAFKSQAG